MLTIRLSRVGRAHKPQYRIVVAEKHRHATKLVLEHLGTYSPMTKEFKIDAERVKYWVGLNVEMSETVKALFKKNSVIK